MGKAFGAGDALDIWHAEDKSQEDRDFKRGDAEDDG